MTIGPILIAVALGCIAWNIVAGILICRELGKRGVKVNYVFIKALIPFYAHRYKKMTRQETGRAGPLFYHWIISINAALVTAVAGLLALYG
jgi:hypothetical protein